MGKLNLTRSWPSNKGTVTTAYEAPYPRPERRLHRAVTPIICVQAGWSLLVLILSIIVVVYHGNGPDQYYFEGIWINWQERVGLIFLWCAIPLATLLIALVDLFRRKTTTARRAAISSGVGMTLWGAAWLLWGQCAYFGLSNICYAGGFEYYAHENHPLVLKFILPWFALGSALVYLAIMIIAIVTLRRQRNAPAETEAYYRKNVEDDRCSFDSSRFGTSTIGDQTLPSAPRSAMPSRVTSMHRSTRPPTYYSSGDDSLLTVAEKDEKDEKDGTIGYA